MTNRKSDLMRLASLGPQMVGSILVSFVLGYFVLDPWLGTFPWMTVVMILLGVFSGFYELYKEVTYLERVEQEDQDDSHS